jgi:hypothetical protein
VASANSIITYPQLSLFQQKPIVDWRWYLGRSSNLELLGELDGARSRKLNLALNNPEAASFSISVLDPVAALIEELSTCLVAYRNGVRMWTGPVWTVGDELPEGITEVSCIGWFELLNHRILKCGPNAPATMPTTTATSMTYTETDQTAIMAELFLRTLLDGSFLNPNIFLGSVPSTVANGGSRNITYQQGQNLGQAISTMANVENGFDFRLDPNTLLFNMYYGDVAPDIPGTTINGRGQDRPNTVFGYNWGPSNIKQFKRTGDASKVINDAYVLGQYGLGAQQEPGSISEYGKFSSLTSLSDVVSDTILEAYAAAEVAVHSQPQKIYTFDMLPYRGVGDVPQPFIDYDIGDMGRLGVNKGRVVIPAPGSASALPVRIFAFELEISDEGVEYVKNMQTVYTTSS